MSPRLTLRLRLRGCHVVWCLRQVLRSIYEWFVSDSEDHGSMMASQQGPVSVLSCFKDFLLRAYLMSSLMVPGLQINPKRVSPTE